MAVNSTFKPYSSLTEAPTNLKEAIDWVLRVTGKDGKKNKDECICGLAAAVTDLLQSVELEYHGYEGEAKANGASKQQVTDRLNELFSLVQGLGGTSVVRTYIDQLAQVLSALVGWSRIEKCNGGGECMTVHGGSDVNGNPHGGEGCAYLGEVQKNTPCDKCKCMKWDVPGPTDYNKGHHLGRGCTKCKGSAAECQCTTGGPCEGTDKCKCALAGKCCKCCCKGKCNKCGDKCSCDEEGSHAKDECNKDSYMSAYPSRAFYKRKTFIESERINNPPSWKNLEHPPPGITATHSATITDRRHQCARILLGSVCLIWCGITYMHWTGKYHSSSSYWNNHILDGSGLDDGTLSQWLQALGFPREMLNNSGPQNRLDKVIWDGFMGKLFLGFTHPIGVSPGSSDGTTAKQPYDMNYAGFVHTAHRDSFNSDATVFPKDGTGSSASSDSVPAQHKIGAIFKLYILSCTYFTGLQKCRALISTQSTSNTPRTIREILYWLSALPYSQAYKKMLTHAKGRLNEVTKKPGESDKIPTLAFLQDKRPKPITVNEYNLFAHFQAVTQYCPLVLIGIQGGIHSTKGTDGTKEPPIHSLYANTECNFTYPTVDIQAYNQVVHYIRALFYQLYFLRKQCAVKVTCGGKWRECRYGNGVVSKGVVSWMCLGCNPMEHDRKSRVKKVKEDLVGVMKKVEKEWKGNKDVIEKLRDLLGKIGDVVVQLGNAQERLDRGNDKLDGVKKALNDVFSGVNGNGFKDILKGVLGELETKKVTALEGDSGLKELKDAATKAKTALKDAKDVITDGDVDRCKNAVSAAIDGLHKVLEILKDWWNKINANGCRQNIKVAIINAFENMEDICSTSKCSACGSHSTKCGQPSKPTICQTCHQPTTTGVPSPLQAFLEDRLPGFSCKEVLDQDSNQPNYPPAASHLGHCGGSGQCCPLPMGFRGQFKGSSISDCTGQRLYGILYFFSNENMMQSCVYTLVRVTAELSATTPQVLGDVFGFFRGGVGNKESGKNKKDSVVPCEHTGDPSQKKDNEYFCGWCASGLRDVVKDIEWIPNGNGTPGGQYMKTVGQALRDIKGEKGGVTALKSTGSATTSNLSTITDGNHYVSPLTGELYTAVSATFGGTYLSWVLYLSDALQGGLQSLASAFQEIECRGCKGNCDPNKCKKGEHGQYSGQCGCQSIVSCTGVLPVLYRHGFSYGNPFNLEGYQQSGKEQGDYSITEKKDEKKHCHQFLDSLTAVIKTESTTPLTNLLSQVGKLQYDIRLPWIFVLTLAWLVAVLYLAFGAIWPLDWTHMRSHWLRGGEHQWQCMWYKVMTGRKGMELVEYFGRK